MLPLSQASLIEVYSLHPSLGSLGRIVFIGRVVVLRNICIFVGASVGGALVLATDEEPTTTDIPNLTPKTHSCPNISSIFGE